MNRNQCMLYKATPAFDFWATAVLSSIKDLMVPLCYISVILAILWSLCHDLLSVSLFLPRPAESDRCQVSGSDVSSSQTLQQVTISSLPCPKLVGFSFFSISGYGKPTHF